MSEPVPISRREFIKVSSAAGASLVIGVYLSGCGGPTPTPAPTPAPTAEPTATPAAAPTPTAMPAGEFVPNAFIRIDPDGTVTITVHKPELGQGTRTSLAMIVADELEAEWSRVKVEQAPADPEYGNQLVGGSESVFESYGPLRRAAATARTLLVTAAAQAWGVQKEDCHPEEGAVVHRPTGRRLAYGELAGAAAQLPPASYQLKDPARFRLIGTRMGHVDNPAVVTGREVYGMDVRVPGMLYAVIARSPVIGGKVARYDEAAAKAVPGVRAVVPVESGVAVVAESTWAALKGRDALAVAWDEGPNANLSTADIRAELARIAAAAKDRDKPIAAAKVIEAAYELPYLAHLTMEPMNCTADVRADGCDVWAPTQNPEAARGQVMMRAGLPPKVDPRVHLPRVGGGFGRRLAVDYVPDAVVLSKAIGAPVKVFWTREDDVHADTFRPISHHLLAGGLDEQGHAVAWRHYAVAQSITEAFPAGSEAVRNGGLDIAYRIADKRVDASAAQFPIRTGYWNSVFNGQNAFANECFIDELAVAAGQDPFEFRRALLPDQQRAVLELAAQKSGWGTPLPAGQGRGIAFHTTWGMTHVAQVAEVAVDASGRVRVLRVVCAVDCGIAVNPDGVEAQMEGGILQGLAVALRAEITIAQGRVQQSNYDDHPFLRIAEAPAVEVHIAPASSAAPQGIGEMGLPPIAPAVCNAIFAATGRRVRRLPVRAEDLRAG